jgi:hypothetical protein
MFHFLNLWNATNVTGADTFQKKLEELAWDLEE